MDQRVGFVGIIIENREQSVAAVNELITEFSSIVVARMGVPYEKRGCSVITLVVDTTTDDLGRFTGKLGTIPRVSVKSGLSKAK